MKDQYAVFGHPIKQSKSPLIHNWFAEETNQNMIYVAIEPALDAFKQEAMMFFSQDGQGCNVTAPFKLEAFELADSLTDRARWAGSVNTLKKQTDGTLLGDNTDGTGLVQDLLRQGAKLDGARVLIIGAGGATQGVIKPLLDANVNNISIANRTIEKAHKLVDQFKPSTNSYQTISGLSFEECTQSFDVVINATSAGFSGDLPNLSKSIFAHQTYCYDMSYHQDVTPFNQWAISCGVEKVFDGLGMLVGQAAESFYLWRGCRPNHQLVLNKLRSKTSI